MQRDICWYLSSHTEINSKGVSENGYLKVAFSMGKLIINQWIWEFEGRNHEESVSFEAKGPCIRFLWSWSESTDPVKLGTMTFSLSVLSKAKFKTAVWMKITGQPCSMMPIGSGVNLDVRSSLANAWMKKVAALEAGRHAEHCRCNRVTV